jgi:hypothetical protein
MVLGIPIDKFWSEHDGHLSLLYFPLARASTEARGRITHTRFHKIPEECKYRGGTSQTAKVLDE